MARQVAEAVSAILGAAAANSTQKVAKWEGPDGLTVNLHRQSRRSATVWIAGPSVLAGGRVVLSEPIRIVEGQAPKNSNCSPRIKRGPVLVAYAANDEDLLGLGEALKHLSGGGSLMIDPTATLATSAPVDASTSTPVMNAKPAEQDLGSQNPDDEWADEADDEALALPAGEKRVLTQALDERIESLVSRIRKGRLILQPEFQRDFVWSKSKASLLIESILMRIPLPVVYVAEVANGSWEVVDGQQRLTTIRAFVDGHFPNGESFRLGQLRVRNDLRGKAFKDLPQSDQDAIEDYSLRLIMIQKEADPDLKFEVFERLNSGADKLNDMELRNCIYRGPYNDLLKELVEHEALLKIRGADSVDNRMQDRQLVLRFLAMWRNTHLRYRGPMKQFMNHEMQQHRFAAPDQIAVLRRAFSEAIQIAWDVFGDRAFRRYTPGTSESPAGRWEASGKLNIALWDTLLYVFSYFERRQVLPIADAVREEFLDLMSHDAVFNDYIGRTTDKPDRVRYRAEVWKQRLEALVVVPAGETRAFSRQLKADLHAANPSCAICHQHIHGPDDAEVDHVVHYWRGGPTIPANARLTHRFCNRQRGGREDAAMSASASGG